MHKKNWQVLSFFALLCVLCFAVLHWSEMRQGVKLSGCDSRQFILLCLNCHLMCMQSGTLSEKDTLPHGAARRWGAKTNKLDVIKHIMRWIWQMYASWATTTVPVCLTLKGLNWTVCHRGLSEKTSRHYKRNAPKISNPYLHVYSHKP